MTKKQTKDVNGASLKRLVGRRYHDADRRRWGVITEIKHGMPLMQLASGRRFLIYPDALERGWIECDESPNQKLTDDGHE